MKEILEEGSRKDWFVANFRWKPSDWLRRCFMLSQTEFRKLADECHLDMAFSYDELNGEIEPPKDWFEIHPINDKYYSYLDKYGKCVVMPKPETERMSDYRRAKLDRERK